MIFATRLVLGILPALLAVLPAGVPAQPLPPGVRGGGAATRGVAEYLQRERGVVDALAHGDRQAVLRMLADDFEVRRDSERDAISRDAWLQQELRGNQDLVVHDLSVREFDDIAIVDFRLDRRPGGSKGPAIPARYIVDVWRQSTRQLLARYVSQPRHPIPFTGRPSGRE